MKKRLVNYRFMLCAAVLCGVLTITALSNSEVQAFDSEGIGKMIEIDPGAIAGVAQEQSERQAEAPRPVRPRVPTLGCCQCLNGTNTLDLSTISSNNWIVTDPNGVSSPVAFAAPINGLWNLNTGPAKWVSTAVNGSLGNIDAGSYIYKLDFAIPCCAIQQTVTLNGSCGGDDEIWVYLDNTTPTSLLSQCTTGWCFNISNPPPQFYKYVQPGPHTLIVIVKNTSWSPSGMFINAKLTGTCRDEPACCVGISEKSMGTNRIDLGKF